MRLRWVVVARVGGGILELVDWVVESIWMDGRAFFGLEIDIDGYTCWSDGGAPLVSLCGLVQDGVHMLELLG